MGSTSVWDGRDEIVLAPLLDDVGGLVMAQIHRTVRVMGNAIIDKA